MARFDKYLTPATNMASRLVSAQLRKQAPVDTGRLKRSTRVKVVRTEEGGEYVFDFNYDYLGYGIYTDLGTGPYAVSPDARGEWNPKPGKGKGGIKPRFWNSLADSFWERIDTIIADAIIKAQIEEIEDELDNTKA